MYTRKRGKADRKFLFFSVGLFVLALIALITVLSNHWKTEITMLGSAEETIEVGSSFTDPGATAVGYGTTLRFIRDSDLHVSASGQVNAENTGTYQIRYRASYRGSSAELVRTVKVVDTEPPVIHLTVNPDGYTTIGQQYQEEGYTATDNYDGDLTAKVRREEKNGTVYYTVTDSSGNEGTALRKIVYDDRTPPVLELDGGDETLTEGDDFTDSYSAVDDVDGDVTGAVKVEGSVDTSTPGTYTLKYSVTDAHGNTATATRTVVVKAPDPLEGKDKIVYLTFDDGPCEYTQQLLDVLAKYGAHATFFVTNQFPEYQNMIGKEAAAGHAVGVHTYSHDYKTVYSGTDAFWKDFGQMQAVIKEQTGSETKLMRFPGGSSNSISRDYCKGIMTELVSQATQKGLSYFDWNVDSTDADGSPDKKEIAASIIQGMKSFRHSVVLCHDIHPETVQAMEQVLKWGTERGYTFAALSEGSYTAHHSVNN